MKLEYRKLTAKKGFLFDNITLETIIIVGPSHFAIDVVVSCREAHRGMETEKGINAIQAGSVEALKKTLQKVGIDATTMLITGFTDASIYSNHSL